MVVLLRLILFLSFFALTTPTHVLAQVVEREIILGQSFSLSLQSDNLIEDYAALDLAEYAEHFFLDDNAQTNKRVRLLLTPYAVGEFNLPAIQQGQIEIPAHKITVKPNPEVSITWQKLPENIYLNQWHSQQVGVVVQDRGLGVQLESKADKDFVLQTNPIKEEIKKTKNLEFIYAQKFTQEGLQTWQPAYISIQNRRGGRWLFYPKPQALLVKPSPSYLPADIAIGKLEFQLKRPWINLIGRMSSQKIELTATNTNYLPDLRSQLTIPLTENLQLRQIANSELTAKGYQETLILEQPFRALQTGFSFYPPIRINWINSATGKLENTLIPAEFYLALPLWLAILLAGVGVLLLGVLGFYLIKLLLPTIYWVRLQIQLKLAKTDKEIWQAYQTWAVARGLPPTQTFGAWLKVYQARFGRNFKIEDDLLKLNKRFSNESKN